MVDEEPKREHVEAEKRALLFEEMARDIRLNKDAKFGGAFLVIPPEGGGEPFASLMTKQDESSIFWGAVKTLAEVAMQALDQMQRGQSGFRRG